MTSSALQTGPLSRLPLDLLTDSLLPSLPTRDLIILCRTCHAWHTFLTTKGGACEILWQRRAVGEFNFPVGASGRRTGWFELYGRLARSAAYIWGQNDNGRLALPDATFRLPTSLRSRIIQGGLPLPTRLELPASPVSLVAGGWSFHALTAEGQVISWGTLNGESWARDDAPLRDDGRTVRPMILHQSDAIGPVVQLDAGRRHVVMLGGDGRVWEMRAFGRVVEVVDAGSRWGTSSRAEGDPGRKVVSVHAGWDYSAALTISGDVYVWWESGPALLGRAAEAAGELSLSSPSTEGVAFSLEVDTLRLPPLPSPEKIVLIACGDNFILSLTDQSKLYFLDLSAVPDPTEPHAPQGARGDPEDSPTRSRESRGRLDAQFLTGRRGWRLMERFCRMEEVAKLDGFKEKGIAPGTQITHISAHFKSFAAYSVPSSSDSSGSIVLMGDGDWHEQAEPHVIPELQGIGIIRIAQGDYHNLALTSSGHLYSWGAFSAGALGLGHPQLLNTPLSAPHPPAPPSSTEQPLQPHPMPRPVNPNHPPAGQQPHPLFPGFVPARPAGVIPPPPPRVEKPTRVRFPGDDRLGDEAELEHGGEERQGKFVYAVTASGWHSGALAVDLSTSSSDQATPTATEAEEPIIRLQQRSREEGRSEASGPGVAPEDGTWFGRLGRGFRIGFAGRGMNRGGGGGPVRPPSR
ncbi:hypothetical protein JCM1841_004683 [Sporobolomyces salmonicolor]